MSKNAIILGLVIVVAVGALVLIEERNDGPLENAAESFSDSAESFGESVEDAAGS